MSAAPPICRNVSPQRLARLDEAIFGQPVPVDGSAPGGPPESPWDAAAYGRLLANPAVTAWIAQAPAGDDAGLLCTQRVADEGEVYRIGVLPHLRRQGCARALLAAWLAHAAAQGARSVSLEVRAGNRPAIALYRALGFVDVARRQAYYAAPREDALLMRWTAPASAGGAPRA
ncbi:MAG: GNAT family N-acetyltransferase [Candidatus Lambdaproteobacteria bacterium]|nr:GNAT family N-acetyltransferase [Candidatus Lambdaproteobacteria bacterium]